MAYRTAGATILLLASNVAAAQQPTPLLPSPQGAPPSSIEASPLETPPPGASPSPLAAPPPLAPPSAEVAPAPPAGRVFCNQSVTYTLAGPASAPDPYRQYLGIFSDAAWTPQLCAALIVENVQTDGTATITYVFGPMSTGGKGPGGVLHGTGIVKDGALLFQNSDGSQYAFKPYYTDLAGHWATSSGQGYDAIFKKTY
jgi:hypothetical protein